MIVTLKDGSKKEYAEAKSVIDIAYDISEGLARAACAGEVNGEVVDLRTVIDSDCEFSAIQHPTYLPRQYRPYSRMQRLLSDLLLIQDSTMISTALHSPVMTWMQSKKK